MQDPAAFYSLGYERSRGMLYNADADTSSSLRRQLFPTIPRLQHCACLPLCFDDRSPILLSRKNEDEAPCRSACQLVSPSRFETQCLRLHDLDSLWNPVLRRIHLRGEVGPSCSCSTPKVQLTFLHATNILREPECPRPTIQQRHGLTRNPVQLQAVVGLA